MLDFTLDILLIGFITVLMIELVKAPIKAILVKKGLKDNDMASKIFKIVAMLLSYVFCFVGALIYFHFYLHVNPFAGTKIIWYTIGTVGASQSIYGFLETYGRDGVLAIIKALVAKSKDKSITDMSKLSEQGLDTFATQIVGGINTYFEDAPITKEDIKQILKNIK